MIEFRCDDVSINTDLDKLDKMLCLLRSNFQCRIICGISPLVHNMDGTGTLANERIFPKILNAYSDFRLFYHIDKAGIPEIKTPNIEKAAHGLIHVDHRLLSKEAQEMSIIVSSSLAQSKIFIPPFNKWNKDTETICQENSIELIKFESGWKHILYNQIIGNIGKYYFHTHDFSFEDFAQIIERAQK